ncbi:MAG: hypothetical protein V4516_09945 [Pseudomonadota bacterium]
MRLADADPKGLIRESYAIEGITAGECRSIFLDWALSLPAGVAVPEVVAVLQAEYATQHPDHPMNRVLLEALSAASPPRRKGGRAGRVPG